MKKFYLRGKQIDSQLHNKILVNDSDIVIIANPGGIPITMLFDDVDTKNNETELNLDDPLLIRGLEAAGIDINNSYIIRMPVHGDELYVTPKVAIYGISNK